MTLFFDHLTSETYQCVSLHDVNIVWSCCGCR